MNLEYQMERIPRWSFLSISLGKSILGEQQLICMVFVLVENGFPGGSAVKNLLVMQETQVWSLGQEDPLRRAWQPTPVFWPGESNGQRRVWQARVHRVSKSWRWLKQLSMHAVTYDVECLFVCLLAISISSMMCPILYWAVHFLIDEFLELFVCFG